MTRKLFDIDPDRLPSLNNLLSEEDHDKFEKFWDFTIAFLNGTKTLNNTDADACSNSWVDADHQFNTAVQMIKDGGDTKTAVYLIADIFGLVYPMNYNCYKGY